MTHLKRHVVGAFVFAFMGVVGMKVYWKDARVNHYAEFHRNYDPWEHYDRIKNSDILQAVGPNGIKQSAKDS